MKAGELRHRVQIQRRDVSYDSRGHEQETWVPVASVSAKVEELSGRELDRARQLTPEATFTVTLRKVAINSSDRLLFGERLLQIGSVITDTVNTMRTCLCVEVRK
jgi:SPP1 family predicted phage head-tail adaptor